MLEAINDTKATIANLISERNHLTVLLRSMHNQGYPAHSLNTVSLHLKEVQAKVDDEISFMESMLETYAASASYA